MLEASYGEWGKAQLPDYRAYSLEELSELVDRFAAAPPLSSYCEGALGTHAWISIIDCGFVGHFYFGEETRDEGTIQFELYGPVPPGMERVHNDPYDGSGLAGTMTTACLKGVLSLLDQGQSPVDHVRRNALSVSVVADD